MALDKKTLDHFDAMHDVLIRQLPLPGIGEPIPCDSWERIRATRRFISATRRQTAYNEQIAKLAKRSA
jgi:hypothetical protein